MKKIILSLLFLLIFSTISYSQKPMIGFTEDLIKKINKDEFGYNLKFNKDYFEEFWVLHTQYLGIVCIYYFEYGAKENFLFIQIHDDMEIAEQLYNTIKKNHISLSNYLFYEERTSLYIKFKKNEDSTITVTWSKERIKN